MKTGDGPRQRGWNAAGALMALGFVLAGCVTGTPAPVITAEPEPPAPRQIIVQRGQTLSGIAHTYHVPMGILAEANHLAPPYRILAGQALLIPAGSEPYPRRPVVAMTEPIAPPRPSPSAPQTVVAPVAPSAPVSPQPPSLDRPPPPTSARAPAASEAPIALTPPKPETSANPTKPSKPAAAASAASEREQPSGLPAASGSTATEAPPSPPSHGAFLWPVRGRVVAGFGVGPDGTHNDGINIAAPRGAAITATDAGVVAYSGNELRGYGNLVLIKHPGGWISAYAHCDLILVKPGQKVARGQVIGRVGATGNVSEPQLHFELRRGKKPVDPREYLAPLPTAAVREGHPS